MAIPKGGGTFSSVSKTIYWTSEEPLSLAVTNHFILSQFAGLTGEKICPGVDENTN